MRSIFTLAKKELFNYFSSPVGYIFAGLMLIIVNWLFFNNFFLAGQADLTEYWTNIALIMSLFVPAISMNLIAEERKNSTWELLLSLPIKEKDLVLGKFIGSSFYLLMTLLLSIPVIITVFILGNPGFGIVVCSLIGITLLVLSYLSLGLFMSSLTKQPIVSFMITTIILLINNMIGQNFFLVRLPPILRDIISGFSLNWRSSKFFTGLIEINDLIFFISWISLFILMTIISLKSRSK